MTYQLATAKIWDGTQWVAAAGGGGGQWWPNPVTSWTSFVTATANSSAHTKGAWVELVASTSAAADCVDIALQGVSQSGTNTATLLDIGIGAAGSETAIISDVAVGGAAALFLNGELGYRFSVPVYVPSGSRIAARIQSLVTGGKTAQIAVRLGSGPNPSGTSSTTTTIGSSTATSQGTALPSTTAWTQFLASTAAQYESLSLIPSLSSTSIGTTTRQLEIGTGAASAEVAIGRSQFTTSTSEAIGITFDGLVLKTIPQSTRLSVRYTANASNQSFLTVVATQVLGV